jgi:hypothetical protein
MKEMALEVDRFVGCAPQIVTNSLYRCLFYRNSTPNNCNPHVDNKIIHEKCSRLVIILAITGRIPALYSMDLTGKKRRNVQF